MIFFFTFLTLSVVVLFKFLSSDNTATITVTGNGTRSKRFIHIPNLEDSIIQSPLNFIKVKVFFCSKCNKSNYHWSKFERSVNGSRFFHQTYIIKEPNTIREKVIVFLIFFIILNCLSYTMWCTKNKSPLDQPTLGNRKSELY